MQDYTGPDGVPRRREGLVGALRFAPYEAGVVLRTSERMPGRRRVSLRLLRATRTQVEPLFFLYEGPLAAPGGEPAIDVELDSGLRTRPLAGIPRATRPPRVDRRQAQPAGTRPRLPSTRRTPRGSSSILAVIVPTEQDG